MVRSTGLRGTKKVRVLIVHVLSDDAKVTVFACARVALIGLHLAAGPAVVVMRQLERVNIVVSVYYLCVHSRTALLLHERVR